MSLASEPQSSFRDQRSTWRTLLVACDIVQWIVAAVLLNFVLFSGTSVGAVLRWSTAGVLLFAVARSHIWLLLLAIQVSLLVREPNRPDMTHGLASFCFCMIALGLVAFASSFRMTRRHIGYVVASSLRPAAARGVRGGQSDTVSVFGMPQNLRTLLAYRVLVLMAVVAASMLVFTQLPLSHDNRLRWWQRSVSNDLTLWPGPTVLIVAIAFVILFWQSEWRQITPAQARSVLRSALVSSHYPDLKMIVIRRIRNSKRKPVKKLFGRSADAPAANQAANK